VADMAVQRDAMEAAGPYDRARALNAFKLGDVTFYWVTRACAISVLLILDGIILSAKSVRGRDASYLAPPAQIRTSGFPATACMGLSLSRVTPFFAPCLFILLFDPRREHSSAPTTYCVAVARSEGQGRRFFSSPKACP